IIWCRYNGRNISQTFEIYFEQKNFDDYLKIRPFKLLNCSK
ncbi:unnamed protein product, partial [marine sediment metagenome]